MIYFRKKLYKMDEQNSFREGIRDGLPICLGYVSVAFAFGIFAVGSGLSVWEAVLISMTNVTSAGQLAAVPILASGGSILELAVSQLVINARYILMSISLSQKMGKSITLADRFAIAFVNTDETFGVASGKGKSLGRKYMYGLILTPFLGWSVGTLLGSVAGHILPNSVISALEIAIYAMFIAIIIPQAKKSKPCALCILIAVLLSCIFRYVPVLNGVSSGFAIIICAVVASATLAFLAPVKDGEEAHRDA